MNNANQITVMLVDDSLVVRGFIGRALEADPDIKIVASVGNGELGINGATRHQPDIVVLDIEMPVMDGITALPKILQAAPHTKIIMCSTLTVRNAEITLRALSLGAADCIAKPSNAIDIRSADEFRKDILRMVKSIGGKSLSPAIAKPMPAPSGQKGQFAGGQHAPLTAKTSFSLKPPKMGEIFLPQILAIGSSTGGPQALFKLISSFKDFPAPIILTQHMPATFTKILAQHITQNTGVTTMEGEDGMPLERGKVYVAPGGFHMTFAKDGARTVIKLQDGPAENFCKPSVNPMLRSAMSIWGGKILAVILTGMGHDGLESCKTLVESGGRVIAQDQETSVVWGMPGAVATNGLCTAVLPLPELGPWIRHAFGR